MNVVPMLVGVLLGLVSAAEGEELLPPPPQDGPVVVDVRFRLLEIIQIDEENELFEFTGVLTTSWLDPRQAFDPEEAGVAEKFYQGAYQFNELAPAWYPQVALVNDAGMYDKRGVVLRGRPDGRMTLIETVNAVAKSHLDLRRYPFDTQHLVATFMLLGHTTDEAVLRVVPAGAEVAALQERPVRIAQWGLSDLQVKSGEAQGQFQGEGVAVSTLHVTMKVERRALFALRLVVIPLIIMVMLSWSVFWMEKSSLGDRLNISFVGILTVVAYQVMLSETLPRISYVTLMNAFLNMSFFTMCASVVVNLRVSVLDRRGQVEQGDRLDRRCRWLFPAVYAFGCSLAVVVAYVLPPPA